MIIGDLGESLAAVVTPSQWLASQVEKSRIFRGRKARVIRNGIPEIYFSTWKKSTLASPESLRVGFVSSDLQNPYKGFEILLASLELIERDFPGRTELKVLGSGNVKSSLSRFSQAISKSDSATIEFIDSIDVLVVPSLQDNLPNVIPEALSRGKAIIGSDVGGIKEILQQFKMPIFQSGNVNQLSKMLIELKVQRYHSPKIRELARELFGFDVVARNHQSLYEEIM
jgi:glycosyltransferase involved in cell wall biosynthesis